MIKPRLSARGRPAPTERPPGKRARNLLRALLQPEHLKSTGRRVLAGLGAKQQPKTGHIYGRRRLFIKPRLSATGRPAPTERPSVLVLGAIRGVAVSQSPGCGPLIASLYPAHAHRALCLFIHADCRTADFVLALGPPVEPGPPGGALASFANLLSGALRNRPSYSTFVRLLLGFCDLFPCRASSAPGLYGVSYSFLDAFDPRLEVAFYLGPVPACGAPCPVVHLH